MLSLYTAKEKQIQMATRMRSLRLSKGLKQATVCEKSGIALSTLKRFEHTGEISLGSLTRLAWVLGVLDHFDPLFQAPEFRTAEDWIREIPKRGRS